MKENVIFKFWQSYIEMVEILLLFVRVTREGNWKLHLSCVRCTLPWMFAYDRVNYARYLSTYWVEMLSLPTSHLRVNIFLQQGEFVTQHQNKQTCNRDSKVRSGIFGFTQNRCAEEHWLITYHKVLM